MKIPNHHLPAVREAEMLLNQACKHGSRETARKAVQDLQRILKPLSLTHPRLMEAKLRYYECVLDLNEVADAAEGFAGIRERVGHKSRLHIEATFLLAISKIREGSLCARIEAKALLQEVMQQLKNIKSDSRRRNLQKTLIVRIEEEALLSKVIGTEEVLDPSKIHKDAIRLVREKSDDEILETVARFLPAESVSLFQQMRNEVILMLPNSDRLRLPPSELAAAPLNLGKRVSGIILRIVQRTVCDADSGLYKLWSKKLPEMYTGTYFAAAVATALQSYRIGIPYLATGIAALLMRSSAAEFCSRMAPRIMDERKRGKEPRA